MKPTDLESVLRGEKEVSSKVYERLSIYVKEDPRHFRPVATTSEEEPMSIETTPSDASAAETPAPKPTAMIRKTSVSQEQLAEMNAAIKSLLEEYGNLNALGRAAGIAPGLLYYIHDGKRGTTLPTFKKFMRWAKAQASTITQRGKVKKIAASSMYGRTKNPLADPKDSPSSFNLRELAIYAAAHGESTTAELLSILVLALEKKGPASVLETVRKALQ
jgi:hypothetical protein